MVNRIGSLLLVGTTELLVSSTGVYRGQRGRVDSRGRVESDSPHDAALREAAASDEATQRVLRAFPQGKIERIHPNTAAQEE